MAELKKWVLRYRSQDTGREGEASFTSESEREAISSFHAWFHHCKHDILECK